MRLGARGPMANTGKGTLVQTSLAAVAGLVRSDQEDGDLRRDVPPETVAAMALALVIGAQTMADLGMPLDAGALVGGIERMLERPRAK